MKFSYIAFLLLFLGNAVTARDTVVVISEIHYNPASSTDDAEFIELHNLFSVDIDLSNWSLDGAVKFDFPSGTKISAGGRLVVAKNPTALQTATGYSGALGPWTGALNNSGEKISLIMDAIGPRTMDEVDYSDGGQWPSQADGSGASLEKIKVNLPGSEPTSWSWSHSPNGTPGNSPANITLPAIVINEIDAVSSASFSIELHNRGTSGINLNGYVIGSSDMSRVDKILTGAILPAGGFLSVNASTLGYTPADDERLFLYTASKALIIDLCKSG